MNKSLTKRFPWLVVLGLLTACQVNSHAESAAPAVQGHQPHAESTNTDGRIYGTVTETMDAGGYTYVLIDTGKEKLWAAGPATQVGVGSMVAVSPRMPMTDFHSKALNRDFKILYFTDKIVTDNATEAAPADPHRAIGKDSPGQTVTGPVTGIDKAEGGKTVAEILAQKQQLEGQSIRIRGKVVKYTAEVLGKNWIHIRDVSSDDDLTLTTDGTAKIGDVILAEGKLILNKNFGFGYVYDVLLEDATVTIE